jgi:hypothetical protein
MKPEPSAQPPQVPQSPKLLDQVRQTMRLRHMSSRADLRDLRSQDQALHLEPATEVSPMWKTRRAESGYEV